MQMGTTERVRTLMAAADIDIDLEALDSNIKKARGRTTCGIPQNGIH